jgi:PAS domain S-box-containing protein
MKKYIVSAISLLLVLLSCIPVFAGEARVVQVGAFDYYPAIFKDNDGMIKGFYVETLADIAQRENIRFDYVYGTWNEGLDRIKSGEVDLLTSVPFTPERAKLLDFAKEPLQTVWGELYTPLASEIDGILAVRGKKIGLMKDDYNALYFSEMVKKFDITCEFIEMADFDDVFKAITAGQVDAGVVNNTFGAAKRNEYGLRSTGVVFNPFDVFFAVAKGENQDLLALLDRYLSKWRYQADSPYNMARQKWSHGTAGTTQIIPRWLLNSLAALAGVILVSLLFIVLLKRQIRRATADILQSKAVLLESEAKFRSYIDHSPDGIFVTDENGRCLEVNPAAAAITGYSQEELLKMSIFDLSPPESLEKAQYHLQALQETDCAGSEFEFLHKSGKRCWWSIDAVRLSATRYLGFTKDITARRRTEEKLLQAIAAAEAANTAKSRFLANMSHEIRTPMNGMIGLIELLLGTKLTQEQREYAELIKTSGRNLVQLISDILDLSKIEAHKIELETRDFDLQKEVDSTINLLTLHAQGKGLTLSAQIDPDVPLLLKGDAGRLRQILNNIIGNAIKFTAEGSVLLQIRKDAEDAEQTTLRFLVTDTGIGVADDKLEKIFEPFTQVDSSTTRQYGGTGLGLTISRQLAELMGGTIGVEKREENEGNGTTFWFTVVLAKQKDNVSSSQDERIQTVDLGGNLPLPFNSFLGFHQGGEDISNSTSHNTRILLAEDDPINQHMTKLFLTKSGYQVDVANDGRAALKLLEENDYAVVLMDCMMPVLSGYEATAIIRNPASAVRNHAVPVIALTANAMREDRDSCLAAGMDDYLAKPIEVAKVLGMLEKWIPLDIMPRAENGRGAGPCASTIVIFDKGEFVSRSMGDLQLSRYIATIFMENAPEYIEEIRIALADQDAGALRQSAHKLKGAAATMALPQLTETAYLLEEIAESDEMARATGLLPELVKRFEQALEALKELLVISEPASP